MKLFPKNPLLVMGAMVLTLIVPVSAELWNYAYL